MKVSGCCICYILLYIYKWCQYLSFLVILLCRHEHFLLLMHNMTQNESSISLRLLLFVSITIKGDIIFFFWLIFLYRLGNWVLFVPQDWMLDIEVKDLKFQMAKCVVLINIGCQHWPLSCWFHTGILFYSFWTIVLSRRRLKTLSTEIKSANISSFIWYLSTGLINEDLNSKCCPECLT